MENLKPLRYSKFLDGADEAEVALLDEVEEREARFRVPLGDRDDQSQIGADETLPGLVSSTSGEDLEFRAVRL